MNRKGAQFVIDFSGGKIYKLIIHSVGNKLKEDGVILSNECVKISEDSLHNLLGKYFFQRFKDDSLYQFSHETDLGFNEVYQYAKATFEDINTFEVNSQKIAKHLYEASTHPNIKTGELSIAYIKGSILNQDMYDAIGIFKSENKESFLKIYSYENKLTVDWDQGIDTNKLDKGCIIFNNQMEKGFNVLVVDNATGMDTKYWVEDFLSIKKKDNNFDKTKLIVDACKKFVRQDFITEKKEKVSMLNNVLDYFESKPEIELEDFTSNVATSLNRSEELKKFINDYAIEKECRDIGSFSIDHSAVKKIKRSIRNFIKLDTDIEIKIHHSAENNTKYIEKGYDEKRKMYYYKVYFNEEQ